MTQQMCIEAVQTEPGFLTLVPDCFKTQEMCNEVVRIMSCMLLFVFVPDRLKTQEMCNEIVYTMPKAFRSIPDHF